MLQPLLDPGDADASSPAVMGTLNMRTDMQIDMRVGIGIRVGMCIGMCMHLCVHTCASTCAWPCRYNQTVAPPHPTSFFSSGLGEFDWQV